MFCTKCGKSIPDNANVCPECGAEVRNANAQQPNSQPMYPNYQQPVNQQPVYPNYQQPVNPQPVYPNYQQPTNYHPPRNPNDGRGLSIAALVLGICGVVLCWIGGLNIVILVLGILGIVFGVIGRKKSVAAYGKASGLATAGLVLGIIGTAICGIGVLACAACIGEVAACGSALDSMIY